MSDTEVCELLFNAIREREPNLVDKVQGLDGELLKLLRIICLQLMLMIFTYLSSQVTADGKEKGYKVHRHLRVEYF